MSSVNKLIGSLNSLNTAVNNSINSTSSNKLKNNISNATSEVGSLKKALGFGAVFGTLRKGWQVISDIGKANVDMIEANNLFEVTMGKVTDQYGNLNNEASQYYTKALSFQNEMNEKLATNKSELKQFQSMYYNMFKSQGINKDASYMMSENLTKAGYDIASLYNLSVNDSMNKIKSGIAGQVESLRTIGIDVSESSLTRILNDVGIDRTVQQLSYAEKEVARYIAIIQQAGVAQGDFAKTFESPANQLKVFTNQLAELKQVAGSFVMNAFGGIIVWANAIIMAIKEILKSIASVFGYNLDTGGADLSGSTGITDLNDGLGSASKKAKELKRQLMGFDEINNISPESKTGGSGTGVASGVDDKLLKSLKEWDNMMGSISGKAQELRDKILDFLGFTRDINGNLTWSWDKMNNIAKVITVIAGIIGGIYLIGKISKLIKWLGSLWTVLKTGQGATTTFGEGLSIIGKIINGLKTGFTNFGSWISMVVGQYKIFRSQGNGVIESLKLTKNSLKETGQGFSNMIPNVVKVGAGIVGLAGSLILGYASMQDFKNGSISTGEAVTKAGISIAGAAASGALLGSVIPGIGTALGAIMGAIAGTISAIAGLNNGMELSTNEFKSLSKEIDNMSSSYDSAKESIQKSANSKLAEISYAEKLKDSLNEIIDANGKVKKGYEARADIILGELSKALGEEYKRNGNIVTINGEVVTSYDKIIQNIEDLIISKKKQIEVEAKQEIYKESLKQQLDAQLKMKKAQDAYNKSIEEYNKAVEYAQNENPFTTKVIEAKANMKDMENTLTEAKKHYQDVSADITIANDDMVNSIVQTTGELSASMMEQGQVSSETLQAMAKEHTDTFLSELNKLDEGTQAIYLTMATTSDTWNPKLAEKWKELGTTSSGEYLGSISSLDVDTQAKILSTVTTVDNMNDGMQMAWSSLATQSKDVFNNTLSTLPDDVQGQILASVIAVNGMTDTTETAYNNLSDDAKTAFNNAMSSMDTDAKNKVQSAVNGINSKSSNAYNAGANVGSNAVNGANDKVEDRNSGIKSVGNWFVQGFLNVLTGGQYSVWKAGWDLIGSAIKGGNDRQQTGSPAKKTIEMGNYFTEGYIIGVRKKINELKKVSSNLVGTAMAELNKFDTSSVYENMKQLSSGIKVNTKAFEVDANQYIDYGKVSGSVQAQSNVNIGQNVMNGIAIVLSNAMQNADIKVNIEAKTEEGVIVKKATEGFKEYVMQTGELPFPVPV